VATVLLAEPQVTARQVREREFARAGFAVSAITDSGELVRWLLEMAPDVLVLDRRMAEQGCELVEWMREHQQLRRTVCYVMALVPNPEERRLFLAAGADWYLDKNALVNPLPTVVRAALDPAALGALPPQRLAQRFTVKVPVEFMHGRRVTVGESLNISQTGMFLKTPTPLQTGSQTLAGFALPGHRRWETFARVVWTRHPGEEAPSPPGMGLHFFELEPDARAELDVFLVGHETGAADAKA
jgi:uncharacterized protein (TIGR02266 family)